MKSKVRLFWVSASEARRFVEKVGTMYNDIKEEMNEGKKG
jgi:coenzyme F420-reducing hydrogenase delta subunit